MISLLKGVGSRDTVTFAATKFVSIALFGKYMHSCENFKIKLYNVKTKDRHVSKGE